MVELHSSLCVGSQDATYISLSDVEQRCCSLYHLCTPDTAFYRSGYIINKTSVLGLHTIMTDFRKFSLPSAHKLQELTIKIFFF